MLGFSEHVSLFVHEKHNPLKVHSVMSPADSVSRGYHDTSTPKTSILYVFSLAFLKPCMCACKR